MPDLINRKKLAPSTLDALAILERSLPEYAVQPSKGMQYGLENKYVTWRFPTSQYKSLELLHLTDLQFGHIECQKDRILEYRDWVLAAPNRFVLLGGDLIDAATVLSPGQPWDNICGPQSQVYQFCEMWASARARTLGSVGGNHERRGLKSFGDIGLLVAYLLKIPYSSGRQLIDIHYGAHVPFTIDLWHGRGASRTDGAKVMMVSNYVKDHPGSDLYLTGHLHDCFMFQKARERRLHGRNNVKISKYCFGMSSSFLNTWGTYAEVAGLSITDVAMLRAILEPSGKWEMTIR